ncbi:MAG: VCBS repeat-containing protein [Planctomycetota bacterium]
MNYRTPRSSGSLVLCFSAAAALAGGSPRAQEFVDQRIVMPGSDSVTAASGALRHGDIDGDGIDELVAILDLETDYVLKLGEDGFEVVDSVQVGSTADSAFADLNGDGRADYMVSSEFGTLGWHRGLASGLLGAFQTIQTAGPGVFYGVKSAADVDGDGDIDVIVDASVSGTDQIRWYPGNGAGFFSAPKAITVSANAFDLAPGDFDADGEIDVAVARTDSGIAYVLFGSGGTLAPETSLGAGAEARLIEAGDFDGDGITDLACFGSAPAVSWLRGGPGGLTLVGSVPLFGATSGARDLDAVDLDQDGVDDLLAIPDDVLYRIPGQAGVGLVASSEVLDLDARAAAAFEYDGEPGLDLAYLVQGWRNPAFRPGDGDGGFVEPTDVALTAPCPGYNDVSAGDLDRDGVLDLAFEAGVWLRGDGAGGFLPEAPLGARPSELADLDGDGWLDSIALVPDCAPPTGLVLSYGGAGGFGAGVQPPQAPGLILAAVGDVDADGDLDVAAATDTTAFTYLNQGGSFPGPTLTALPGPYLDLTAGDLNTDGLADLARSWHKPLGYFEPAENDVAWGLSVGDGTLAAIQMITLPFQGQLRDLLIRDASGDGFNDLIWMQEGFAHASAALGDGTGALSAPTQLAFGNLVRGNAVDLVDVNGDGAPDLIEGSTFAADGAERISILLWNGSDYEAWRELATPGPVSEMAIVDFDVDGQTDFVWTHDGGVRIARNLRGDGPGTAPFGAGTPGCLGQLSIGTVEPAEIGNFDFRLRAHQVPPGAFGWFAVSNAASLAGSDPFGLGALMHVDPLASTLLLLLDAPADASGQADLLLPIPTTPELAGTALTAQAFHLGVPGYSCSPSFLTLVSSRGLSIVLQP